VFIAQGTIKAPASSRRCRPAVVGWDNYLLRRATGHYDFIVWHYYCPINVERCSLEDVVLTGNCQMMDEIFKTNALMRVYNAGWKVHQHDKEWGIHSSGPQGERADYVRRNANIFGMRHRAVRLIHYLCKAPIEALAHGRCSPTRTPRDSASLVRMPRHSAR
jgi:hypothetical protein